MALEEGVGRLIEPNSYTDLLLLVHRLIRLDRQEPAERLIDQTRPGVAHAVALVESFLDDGPALVEREDTRIGQPDMPRVRCDAVVSVIVLDPLVDKSQLPDDATAVVRKKSERDPMLAREGAEDLDRVVTDREQRHAGVTQTRQNVLQLDQLRSTERSPVRAAVEDYKCLAGPTRRMEIHHEATLIGQLKIGKSLALVRSDLRKGSSWQRHRTSSRPDAERRTLARARRHLRSTATYPASSRERSGLARARRIFGERLQLLGDQAR